MMFLMRIILQDESILQYLKFFIPKDFIFFSVGIGTKSLLSSLDDDDHDLYFLFH
jgi:hypothetical protein